MTGSPTRLNHRPIDSLAPAPGIVGTAISVIEIILTFWWVTGALRALWLDILLHITGLHPVIRKLMDV